MCKALYALPGSIVQPGRKSLVKPIVTVAAGVAVLLLNGMIPNQIEYANLQSAVVLFGAALLLVGLVVCVVRISGHSSRPWHVQDGCFLRKEELKFVKERSSNVRDLVRRGDFATLRSLPADDVSAVTVVLYASPRSGFCAAQVFEYENLELRPVDDMKVVM